MSETRSRRILNERKPIELLNNILKHFTVLLSLPIIVIEEQSYNTKEFSAQLLLLMGESYYPIPKEVLLRNPIENKKHPYLVVDDRVPDLYPFMIWDEIPNANILDYFSLIVSLRDMFIIDFWIQMFIK